MKNKTEITDCSCSCDCTFEKNVIVQYLYLDNQTCKRCNSTGSILDEVMTVLTPALELAGFKVDYKKTEIKTAEIAVKYRFLSSPTIRVNSMDICESVEENKCGCCSDISGTEVDCRVFKYNWQTYEVPPKEMLANSILKSVFVQSNKKCCCDEYELPENLKNFFNGKKNISGRSRNGKCC